MNTKRATTVPTWLLCLIALSAAAFAPPPAQSAPALLVSITGNNSIVSQYNAVTGAKISSPFVSLRSNGAHPMVVDQSNHLFLVGGTGLTGGVGEFDAISGTTINAQFVNVPGLNPQGIALDGNNHLFISDVGTNTVGEYDATTGAIINRNFIQGLSFPNGVAVDRNNHLFVSNEDTNTIGEYDATTGAAINASLISILYDPSQLLVDGLGRLLVAHGHLDSSLIGTFDAATGAAISPGFIYVGPGFPQAFALDGNNHLFEANFYGSVGEYDATTGALINANFVTGGSNLTTAYPTGIVYVPAAVPEPSALVLAVVSFFALLACRRKWFIGRGRSMVLLLAPIGPFAATNATRAPTEASNLAHSTRRVTSCPCRSAQQPSPDSACCP